MFHVIRFSSAASRTFSKPLTKPELSNQLYGQKSFSHRCDWVVKVVKITQFVCTTCHCQCFSIAAGVELRKGITANASCHSPDRRRMETTRSSPLHWARPADRGGNAIKVMAVTTSLPLYMKNISTHITIIYYHSLGTDKAWTNTCHS